MSEKSVLVKFDKFIAGLNRVPEIHRKDAEAGWQTIGAAEESFMAGGPKRDLLCKVGKAHKRMRLKRRTFLVSTPEELAHCLAHWTDDWGWARKAAQEREDRACVIVEELQRKGLQPEVLYGVYVRSDNITPYVFVGLPIWPFNLDRFVASFYRELSETDLRDVLRLIRERISLNDRSLAEAIILG